MRATDKDLWVGGQQGSCQVISGRAWGSTSLGVRASIAEVAAFLWDFGSRSNMEVSGDIGRTFEENAGAASFKRVVSRSQQIGGSHSYHRARQFTSNMMLTLVGNDEIIIILTPHAELRSDSRKMSFARGSTISSHDGSIEARESVGIRLKR